MRLSPGSLTFHAMNLGNTVDTVNLGHRQRINHMFVHAFASKQNLRKPLLQTFNMIPHPFNKIRPIADIKRQQGLIEKHGINLKFLY